jgi:hypothetical protein
LRETPNKGDTEIEQFIEMLRYRRPSGSKAARKFGERFLRPVFGDADRHGNYSMKIGEDPSVMFAAHYDTVHSRGGQQSVQIEHDFARLPDKSPSNCLGADCTAGVWLILEMIKEKTPGAYAIFADVEFGCIGSNVFITDSEDFLAGVNAMISLDRRGYSSVVTHQIGTRTASDAFAKSVGSILAMDYKPDTNGAFTDSSLFSDLVPECSNLSVGYHGHHSQSEVQDLDFLKKLRGRMVSADWSGLTISRKRSAA